MTVENLLLYASLVLSIFSLFVLLLREVKENVDLSYVKWALRGTMVLLSLSVFLLIYYLSTSNFTIFYVYQYTSRDLSMIYKISAFLIGHEGSLLYLAWIIFIISVWISAREALNKSFIRKTEIIIILVGLLFLSMTILKSPFRSIFEVYPSMLIVPKDGLGINPILKNMWMVLHPPTVFLAYGIMVVTFATALVNMCWREERWEHFSRAWSRLAWFFLGIGIVFGCVWSYEVWEGYWIWDPAFTSILMVWLLFTAYLHASSEYRKERRYKVLAPALAIYSFVLALYSTYIIRSGVIRSVHSFGDTVASKPLLYAVLAFTLISTGLVIFRSFSKNNPEEKNKPTHIFSSANAFNATILLFVGLAFILFWGLTYVLVQLFFGVDVSVSVRFFNTWGYPFTVFLLLVMGFCMLMDTLKKDRLLRISLLVVVTSIVSALIKPTPSFYLNSFMPVLLFAIGSVAFKLSGSIRSVEKIASNTNRIGRYSIHLGVALILIGAIISTVFDSSSKPIYRSFGETKTIRGYDIQLYDITAYHEFEGKKIQYATIRIFKDKKLVNEGRAEFEYDPNSGDYLTRILIYRGLISDVHITFQGVGYYISENNFFTVLTVRVVPGVSLLWFGTILLAGGIIPLLSINFTIKRDEK